MQIGIDLGATKIESVVLDENGSESFRERIECPKIYVQTVEAIKQIVFGLEKKLNKKLERWCMSSWNSFHTYRSSKKCSELLLD
jgi:predicted NBD/HSP70 family sugar kinase